MCACLPPKFRMCRLHLTKWQNHQSCPKDLNPPSSERSTYGPNRRVHGKAGPQTLHRQPAMRQDDSVDMMREIVPHMLEQTSDTAMTSSASTASGSGQKRSYDVSAEAGQRPRIDVALPLRLFPWQTSIISLNLGISARHRSSSGQFTTCRRNRVRKSFHRCPESSW